MNRKVLDTTQAEFLFLLLALFSLLLALFNLTVKLRFVSSLCGLLQHFGANTVDVAETLGHHSTIKPALS